MELAPWDYLFLPFNDEFPFKGIFGLPEIVSLFDLTWILSLVGLVVVSVLYAVKTRSLRRHPPYLDMYEWLLWTSLIFFFLLLVYAVFHFDFIFLVITVPIFLGLLVWIRFVKFPPELARYEHQLARARFYSRQKFAHPESTIRPKRAKRRKR